MLVTTYTTEINGQRRNVLVKESTMPYGSPDIEDTLTSPDDIFLMMCSCFRLDRMAEEYLYMLGLDGCGHLIGVFNVSHGTATASMASGREIYIRALLCGAVHIILIHNHPSGDPEPSKEDIMATNRIAECGKMLGVTLSDHVIIGSGRYYSFCENGGI
ncbi:MAG: JAB domain-containing protein [Clostridiales bacterium]|nr:JAB domain-containing protein [Clostridiales bacterium]